MGEPPSNLSAAAANAVLLLPTRQTKLKQQQLKKAAWRLNSVLRSFIVRENKTLSKKFVKTK
jgi:hypothetical protein